VNRDELLDRAVGKCVPLRTDGWGRCSTHNVGWGPAAFESGRCWRVRDEVKAVEVALFFLGSEVEALTHDGLTAAQSQVVLKREVMALIDGTFSET